jgi:predicted molibdopterin-dependent oxidoreductase YjgC
MPDEIQVTIDGKRCTGRRGQTILEVARENGIWIPTLCYEERLSPYGACRVCLVAVEGARALLPACYAEITPDMVVTTSNERIDSIRRTIIELLLSDHPTDCMTCESTGNCTLQDLAYRYGIKESPYKGDTHSYHLLDDNPVIERDLNKCVLCGRCVRICEEVVGAGVYCFVARGFDAIVSTPYDHELEDSPCLFCGQCVSTCPVGALSSKLSIGVGRPWELEKTDTICPYCGVGCTLTLWTRDNKVVNVTAPLDGGVNRGNLCVKGRFGYQYIDSPERLTRPLIKGKDGRFRKVTWEKAIKTVSERLSEVKEKEGPDAIGGLACARATNEDNYVFQKFIRAVVGTNNVDHCARL